MEDPSVPKSPEEIQRLWEQYHGANPYDIPPLVHVSVRARRRAEILIGRISLAWAEVDQQLIGQIQMARMSEGINARISGTDKKTPPQFEDRANLWLRLMSEDEPAKEAILAEIKSLHRIRNNLAHNIVAIMPDEDGFYLMIEDKKLAEKTRIWLRNPSAATRPLSSSLKYDEKMLLSAVGRVGALKAQLMMMRSEQYGRELEKRPWRQEY